MRQISYNKICNRRRVALANGKVELVVQDPESYQAHLEATEWVKILKGIKRSLEEMKQGKGKQTEDFFPELFDKLDGSQ